MKNAHTLHAPPLYALILTGTVLVGVLSLWNAIPVDTLSFGILIVAVVLTGIPHGAVDHLVAAELYELDATWRDQSKFYGFYLVLMAAYGGLWLIAPQLSLGLFLLMTMYHFGQADLAYLSLDRPGDVIAYLSRGLVLIGLPVVAFPGIVAPIFDAIAGVNLMTWPALLDYQALLVALIVAQHLAVLTVTMPVTAPAYAGRELLNLTVLTFLFVAVHPLLAFAVYFGGWHSLGHILELLRFFSRRGRITSLSGFYRNAALFTLLSFAGLGVLYLITKSFTTRNEILALLFIVISLMTLPHIIIVERLYQTKKTRPA